MKRLWTQQSRCAFHDPQCNERLVDESSGVVTAEVCHIRSSKDGGPRFATDYKTHDEFENLILMCPAHHKVIDSPHGVERYPRCRTRELEAPEQDLARFELSPH